MKKRVYEILSWRRVAKAFLFFFLRNAGFQVVPRNRSESIRSLVGSFLRDRMAHYLPYCLSNSCVSGQVGIQARQASPGTMERWRSRFGRTDANTKGGDSFLDTPMAKRAWMAWLKMDRADNKTAPLLSGSRLDSSVYRRRRDAPVNETFPLSITPISTPIQTGSARHSARG